MLNDLNDLKRLLTLCRKYGVTDIELGTTKLKLGDLPDDRIPQPDDDREPPYDQDRVILEQLGISL